MKLESIFQSGMVFQQKKPIRIFGTGDGVCRATLGGNSAESVRDGDGWLVTLPPMEAGGPYTLFLDLDGEKTELSDILIGEVFLASGQSNMEMPLFRTTAGFAEAKHAKDDGIRFYTVPRRVIDGVPEWNRHFESICSEDTVWQPCDEDSALHFSAIGYYFAKELRETLGVPVGIVSANWGGCTLRTFVPRDALMREPAIIPEIERIEQLAAKYSDDEQLAIYRAHCAEMEKQCRATLGSFENTRIGGNYFAYACDAQAYHAPACPFTKYSPNYVSVVWNAMIRHLLPFSFAGVLWYQGESDGGSTNYTEKYGALLSSWREHFRDPDLPFFAVELAPCCTVPRHLPQRDNVGWAFLREQQQRATVRYENNYLATVIDAGDPLDIHPSDKRTPAHRLCLLARRYVYREDVVADAPCYDRHEILDDGSVIVHIRNAKKLAVGQTRDFWLCGEDHLFYPAACTPVGDAMLKLTSSHVPHPVAARYGFFDFPAVGFLYNEGGLPLMPFRTDSFTDVRHITEQL